MAIELVTGHSGAAHVSGADAGAMHAGICGSDSYVLGAVPSVTMSDANTLVIQPCDLMVEGRHVRLSGTNTLSIRSGAQTGKRNDLVYVRYTYDSSTGTESAKLGVKEGTTATTATDPALDNPSSVLDGATIADVAIARVSLDALTPTATWLLPQLPTLAALGDSVSHGRFYHGSKSLNAGSSATSLQLMSNANVKALIGRDFDPDTDFCTAMNGDAKANALTAMSVSLKEGALYVCFASAVSWGMRINWMLWAAS
jgi:hypothetical protein